VEILIGVMCGINGGTTLLERRAMIAHARE
jgi:hypothetical protein